jgi:histidine triad (HIT) family protein
MEPSIFTKIINGEIPCHKVYEDDKTFAFMDIYPIQTGMVLVIPKEQIANIEDLSEDLYLAVMETARKIQRAQRKVFPDKFKMAMQIEGLDVQHVHVKLFPIDTPEEFHAHAPTTEPNHEELAELAEKIRSNI